MGGEHDGRARTFDRLSGSSPRGRGTQCRGYAPGYDGRIIPAWAGNTSSGPRRSFSLADHPRVGGEHDGRARTLLRLSGSSPRGGEHSARMVGRIRIAGSSPRGRGTLRLPQSRHSMNRIIPAWAGNTGSAHGLLPSEADHPRVGGEHCRLAARRALHSGSSPRGRGTQGFEGSADAEDPDHPRVGGEHSSCKPLI